MTDGTKLVEKYSTAVGSFYISPFQLVEKIGSLVLWHRHTLFKNQAFPHVVPDILFFVVLIFGSVTCTDKSRKLQAV